MGKRLWQYPEVTNIDSDDFLLLDNESEGSKCIKANKIGAVLIDKTVTERKTYTASDDSVNGYKKVIVDVPYTDVHYEKDDIVSFTGEDFPLKSLTAYITAIQDLHGYYYPWVGGSGKNLFNMGSKWSGSDSGLSFTTDDDYVTMNGVKSGANYVTPSQLYFDLPAGTYYAKAFVISGTASNKPSIYVYSNQELTSNMLNTGRSFTLESQTSVGIRFTFWNDGATYSNYKIGIVISKDADIDKFYPYSNICPISGWSAVDVTRCGKNLFDAQDIVTKSNHTTYTYIEDGYLHYNAGNPTVNGINWYDLNFPCPLTFSGSIKNFSSLNENAIFVAIFDDGTESQITIAQQLTPNEEKSFSVIIGVSGKKLVGLENSWASARQLGLNLATTQLELGTTATAYEPYNGQTYTIDLDGTRYGGKLDLVSGVLTVTHQIVDLGDATWSYNDLTNVFDSSKIASSVVKPTSSTEVIDLQCSILAKNSSSGITDNPSVDGIAINTLGYIIARYSGMPTSSPDFKTAVTGQKLKFPLATPLTYQLSKQQIRSLVGENNIFADTGEVAVEWQTLYQTPSE